MRGIEQGCVQRDGAVRGRRWVFLGPLTVPPLVLDHLSLAHDADGGHGSARIKNTKEGSGVPLVECKRRVLKSDGGFIMCEVEDRQEARVVVVDCSGKVEGKRLEVAWRRWRSKFFCPGQDADPWIPKGIGPLVKNQSFRGKIQCHQAPHRRGVLEEFQVNGVTIVGLSNRPIPNRNGSFPEDPFCFARLRLTTPV